jgi:hypothetical protein
MSLPNPYIVTARTPTDLLEQLQKEEEGLLRLKQTFESQLDILVREHNILEDVKKDVDIKNSVYLFIITFIIFF